MKPGKGRMNTNTKTRSFFNPEKLRKAGVLPDFRNFHFLAPFSPVFRNISEEKGRD